MTRTDFARLTWLKDAYSAAQPSRIVDRLSRNLSRAVIVDDRKIARDVVTMGSQVLLSDESGRIRSATLVYPSELPFGSDRISVLSPLGAALIGAREGQSVAFETADRQNRCIKVIKVLYQPEADGG